MGGRENAMGERMLCVRKREREKETAIEKECVGKELLEKISLIIFIT